MQQLAQKEAAEKLKREQEQEQKIQAELRNMGQCEAGFQWLKIAGGYMFAFPFLSPLLPSLPLSFLSLSTSFSPSLLTFFLPPSSLLPSFLPLSFSPSLSPSLPLLPSLLPLIVRLLQMRWGFTLCE
jgi:hypothetical protein